MIYAPAADGLVQEETGGCISAPIKGKRRGDTALPSTDGEAAMIYHADGSLFHALDLSSGTADILHPCADDIIAAAIACFIAIAFG